MLGVKFSANVKCLKAVYSVVYLKEFKGHGWGIFWVIDFAFFFFYWLELKNPGQYSNRKNESNYDSLHCDIILCKIVVYK